MLLKKLNQKQQEAGYSDDDMARELGISRQLWQGTRTGRIRIGESVIRGTLRRFRDLTSEVLVFLSEDAKC